MGMFDEIVVPRSLLPGTPPDFVQDTHVFQTKDLICDLSRYEVDDSGRFIDDDVKDFTGSINFYSNNQCASWGKIAYTRNGENAESVSYTAVFVDGKLHSAITEDGRKSQPALPQSQMAWSRPPLQSDIETWKRRKSERLTGRTLCVCYGSLGSPDPYLVTVIAENDEELVWQRQDNGGFEVEHRSSRDRIFFDSCEAAIQYRKTREDEYAQEKAKYDELSK